MKKSLLTLILAATLIFNLPIFTIAQANLEREVTNRETTNNKERENPSRELTEEEKNATIRDQDILVPTKNGVQQATFNEATLIKKYEAQSLESLTSSYLLGDYSSGEILESYNIDEIRPMASTSKLVGIFVIMDMISEGKISKNDMVKIDLETSKITGSSFKLKENDETSVNNLLKAALIISGNDAITALGKYVAGSSDNFVALMNKKCKDLGLNNAHMVNPTGLTDYSITDYNKMTTREMFILSCELLRTHPDILNYTKEPFLKDDSRNFIEYSTNPILGIVPEIDGLKTGYTNAAGRCVIETGLKKGIDQKSKNMRLIGITTGSLGDWQRYVACKRLMSNGFENYENSLLSNPKKAVAKINVEDAQDDEISVYPKNEGYIIKNLNDNIKEKIRIDDKLKAPIEAGSKIGKISYYSSNDIVYETDLIVKDKVYEKGFLHKIKRIYEEIFKNIEKAA